MRDAYAAFVYDDHYCYGIANSFAGVYKSRKEATEIVRGDRFSRQNLEIMNLSTFGITRYTWVPLYEYAHRYDIRDGKHFDIETLKHRWDETKPVIDLEMDGPVRRYGHNNVFYEAGEWELQRC